MRGDSVAAVLRHSTIKNVHYVVEDIFEDIVRPSSSFKIILTEIYVYYQRVSGRAGAKDERIVGDEKQLYKLLVISQSSLKLRRLKLEM